MSTRYLLCTDLDRTLLPNGRQPESSRARDYFARLAARPELDLAYVSGRSLELITDAIADYDIPEPDYVLADVGTSIYVHAESGWQRWKDWDRKIENDWQGHSGAFLARLLTDLKGLRIQESHKQGDYKLSYYVKSDIDARPLLQQVQAALTRNGINASLVWSIDEPAQLGLLDILPASASKLQAIEFLISQQGHSMKKTVFAGDSGNDLPVLISPINSVLVANASTELKSEAIADAQKNHCSHALYVASGGCLGMNGNYSAGILEGIVHYLPEARQWLQELDP